MVKVKNKDIILTSLGHTWILDLDGTLVNHNGYLLDGKDVFLNNAKEFLESIPDNDMIIFLTSRKEEYKQVTETFLQENNVWYNHIIYNAPYGERILINDKKESGLSTAIALNLRRDEGPLLKITIDEEL